MKKRGILSSEPYDLTVLNNVLGMIQRQHTSLQSKEDEEWDEYCKEHGLWIDRPIYISQNEELLHDDCLLDLDSHPF